MIYHRQKVKCEKSGKEDKEACEKRKRESEKQRKAPVKRWQIRPHKSVCNDDDDGCSSAANIISHLNFLYDIADLYHRRCHHHQRV